MGWMPASEDPSWLLLRPATTEELDRAVGPPIHRSINAGSDQWQCSTTNGPIAGRGATPLESTDPWAAERVPMFGAPRHSIRREQGRTDVTGRRPPQISFCLRANDSMPNLATTVVRGSHE